MIIYLALLLLIFIVFWTSIARKRENENKLENTKVSYPERKNKMEELFLKEVNSGEKKKKLTHLLDEFSFSYIKTLFEEDKIPYYAEFDNTLDIWPSMKTEGNINIYILEKDYDNVMKLIEENKKGIPVVSGTE